MERLTINSENGWALKLDNPQTDVEAKQQLMCKFKIACAKLGELEDLMEIEGFDSIEHLQRFVFEYKAENEELKNHTKDLNNKLLNIQLFLKELRDSFHKGDETYDEIDKKLKELGGVDERNTF